MCFYKFILFVNDITFNLPFSKPHIVDLLQEDNC